MNDANYQSGMIDPLSKGIGDLSRPLQPGRADGLSWNLLKEDLSLPTAVLYEERLSHNLNWMRSFVTEYGVKLAPHGKTTMAPTLFARQLAAGAWGITLASAHQTRVAYHHGVRRVLMANQLVGRQNMRIISRLLEDPGFEFFCLIDSAELVDQLGCFFAARKQTLNVLLEFGPDGGRAGVRNDTQQETVLAALQRWQGSIVLSGVEVYEGVLQEEADIRLFLRRAVRQRSGPARLLRSSFGAAASAAERRRFGLVRCGCGRIRQYRHRPAAGHRAASRLLSDT
ncbi:MAG: alanine racemase [Herbaspirillum sp.]